MRRYWFAYTGNGDDTNPGNYILVNWAPEFTCLGGSITCAVYAHASEINPLTPFPLSNNLKTYLTAGKALLDKYPNDGVNKPYIYTRPLF